MRSGGNRTRAAPGVGVPFIRLEHSQIEAQTGLALPLKAGGTGLVITLDRGHNHVAHTFALVEPATHFNLVHSGPQLLADACTGLLTHLSRLARLCLTGLRLTGLPSWLTGLSAWLTGLETGSQLMMGGFAQENRAHLIAVQDEDVSLCADSQTRLRPQAGDLTRLRGLGPCTRLTIAILSGAKLVIIVVIVKEAWLTSPITILLSTRLVIIVPQA